MVVRADAAALEVLMLRRSLASVFVSGAYVFPGGALDPDDSDPRMFERCTGRSDDEASALLEIERGGLAYWVSAFRECFEESGVLSRPRSRRCTAELRRPGYPARSRPPRRPQRRRAIVPRHLRGRGPDPAGRRPLLRRPLDHAGGAAARYDTRFFAALAPSDQVAVHDEVETIGHMWIAPAEALAQHEAGEIEMLFPTVWNLRLLARYATPATWSRRSRSSARCRPSNRRSRWTCTAVSGRPDARCLPARRRRGRRLR